MVGARPADERENNELRANLSNMQEIAKDVYSQALFYRLSTLRRISFFVYEEHMKFASVFLMILLR